MPVYSGVEFLPIPFCLLGEFLLYDFLYIYSPLFVSPPVITCVAVMLYIIFLARGSMMMMMMILVVQVCFVHITIRMHVL